MAQLRLADFFPVCYSGDKILNEQATANWFSNEDYCTMHNFMYSQTVQRFQLTLTSKARLWIDGKQFANRNELQITTEKQDRNKNISN